MRRMLLIAVTLMVLAVLLGLTSGPAHADGCPVFTKCWLLHATPLVVVPSATPALARLVAEPTDVPTATPRYPTPGPLATATALPTAEATVTVRPPFTDPTALPAVSPTAPVGATATARWCGYHTPAPRGC